MIRRVDLFLDHFEADFLRLGGLLHVAHHLFPAYLLDLCLVFLVLGAALEPHLFVELGQQLPLFVDWLALGKVGVAAQNFWSDQTSQGWAVLTF